MLFWQWRPIGGVVWAVQDSVGRYALYALCACGWLTVLVTTFLINHFDLFGLRQVWLHLRGKPYTALGFVTPGPYKYIRHPLYIGWMTAFWATPIMTVAHYLFALAMTAYMLFAIRLEERDLVAAMGRSYANYRQRVPMLIPRLGWPARSPAGTVGAVEPHTGWEGAPWCEPTDVGYNRGTLSPRSVPC